MKHILLFVLTTFFLSGCQQLEKNKDIEMQRLTNENKELREYIKSLRKPYSGIIRADLFAVLYWNIENPISIVVPGFLNEDISITVENGTYKKCEFDEGGEWIVRPDSVGKRVTVKAYATIDGETMLMATRDFSVILLPFPSAYIRLFDGTEITDSISVEQLKSVKSLIAKSVEPLQVRYKMLSFSVVYSDSEKNKTVKESSTGNEFTEKQRKMFAQLKKGGKIHITDIIVIGADKMKRETPPMEILIVSPNNSKK